jgi:hypothetical protein
MHIYTSEHGPYNQEDDIIDENHWANYSGS